MYFQAEKVLNVYFEEQTEAAPDRIAVFCAQEFHSITYRELNERADLLAHRLQDMGVKPDTIVALMVTSSIECILGIMAILKAGGAYLPIDPHLPEKRIGYILKESNAKILLVMEESQKEIIVNCQLLIVNCKLLIGRPRRGLHHSSFIIHHSNHLSYIIYTSGSTGAPKGVAVEHRNVVNLVLGLYERVYYQYGEGLRVALAAPCIFDGSVKQIFGALLLGHTLCIVPEDTRVDGVRLAEFHNKYFIDISDGTPAHIRLLTGVTPAPGIKHFLIGGEALSASVVERFYGGYTNCKSPLITNVYGPTECCVDTTAFEVSRESIHKLKGFDVVPIGTPLANQEVTISKDTGELCIAGANVSRGYLNNPELTAERFNRSYRSYKTYIFYKSGDLARILPEGNIVFLGRIDQQVKVRGYRIELGEIEVRLATHPAVKEAVVTAREDNFGEKYLCAYVVLAAAAASISAELKAYLSLTLPGYMVPLFFEILDKMPLTASGKVDRRSLPAPIPTARASYAAPGSVMEKTLVEIWSGVLGIDAEVMGVADHFLEWGGHSLKATAIIAHVYDKFYLRLSLADVFKYPDIRQMAQFLEQSPRRKYPAIEAAVEKPFYRLSSAQKRIYIASQMAPDTTLYNITLVFQIAETAALNPGRLRNAFKQLIARHESFRTSFHLVDDQPRQMIHKKVEFKVKEEKGFHHSSFIIHHFIKPFDLSRAPLLRVKLFKTGDGRRLLLIDMHHIISDGLSVEILQRELEALSMGRTLPPLPLCCKDYAEWEHGEQWLERLKKQEQYWLKEFNDDTPPLHLPLDYPRPPVPSYKGDAEEFQLDEKDTAAWNHLAKEYHMTPFMLALAVFAIFLSKLSDQETVIVGTVHDGRENPQLRSIIGMFVNTTAIRCFPLGLKPLGVFLEETGATVRDVFENRDYPFEQLVEKLAQERDPSRHPLFDVMLAFRDKNEIEPIGERQGTAGGLKLKRLKYHEKTAKYDLVLSVAETDGKLDFILNYSIGLFKAETILRFVTYLKKITDEVLQKNRDTFLCEIDPIPEEERRRILYRFNKTTKDYPGDRTIHWLFAEQAEKTPDSIALVGAVCPISLSYRQLNEQSDRRAGLLIEKGVLVDDIVAIMIERSIEMIIGILGILKSGGAYLPIDPGNPRERIQYMLKDSNARILMGMEECQRKIIVNCKLLIGHPHRGLHHSNQLAYIIYTSGSTGKPKGVPITHANVSPLLHWGYLHLGINEKDRVIQNLSYYFDWSVWEIFITLTTGASLLMISEELLLNPGKSVAFIRQYAVTVLHVTPTQYRYYLAAGQKLETLRYLFIGAEPLGVDLAKRSFQSVDNDCRVFNMYGPTEATIIASVLEIARTGLEEYRGLSSIPIGSPVGNAKFLILDKHYQLCPINVTGELYIGGSGLARGYLNNPELTAERFNRSYRTYRTYIFYRTGDLARWLTNGHIEFLGRVDQQVKIRGFRIELGEIETCLANHPFVKEAVVTAREDKPGEKRLCAYITPREPGTIDVRRLKEYLTQYLPQYMVPQYYVEMGRLPLTANGKVDRRALPEPRVEIGGVYASPRGPAEEALVKIWRDLLFDKEAQTPLPGIDDNFFEIGGHSLKATVLAGRIEKIFHIRCPLTYIFQHPTIRELACLIRETAEPWNEQIPPVEEKEYYPLSSAQKRLFFLDRWENIGVSYNMTFAFSVKGKLDIERLEKVSLLLIERHECLRTSFHLMGDEPVQRINNSMEFKINVATDERCPGQTRTPFDLSRAPLFSVEVISLSAEEALLIFDMHHIIGDGTSMGVFIQEFSCLYNSGYPGVEVGRLPVPDVRYRDFAQWQNRLLESGKIKEQEEYWLNLYPDADEIPRLELPVDFPRPGRPSFEGDHYRFSLTPGGTRQFRQSLRIGSVTPYMGLLAAFIVLLYKYSGQNDMVVGAGVMGRRHAALENIIGMFVNTLAIRHFPNGEISFEEFLNQVKDNNIKAFENQDVQFEALVERLNLPRDPTHNPLFDVLFVMQNFLPGELLLEGVELTPYPLEKKNSKFDVTLFAQEKEDSIAFTLEYCTALFKRETMERMAGYFVRVLNQVCETRGIILDAVELLSTEEKRQLVEDFNRTAAEYPAEKAIHQLFAEQIDKTPDRIALFGESVGLVSLTYRQLHEQSNRLANYLYGEIVMTPGECIAILLDRSIDRVMAILGVLKSGSAYIPLESTIPEERIKNIIDDGAVRTVISQKKYIRLLNRLQWECCSLQTFLCLDSEDIHAELEAEQSELMSTKLWEYVGETATDEITGGGWISSYTGEPIPAAEMAEYGDNILQKVEPLLHEEMRVLEIGCATGITMFRIAPRVGFYYGTDLSPVIIEKNKQRINKEGRRNIRLKCMAAHEIDRLEEENFDLAIINSVIQCFHGHNYLRQVLKKVAAKISPSGYLFIGDIMDQELKDSLIREMQEFKKSSGSGVNSRTKTDWSAELFISRDFFEDLQWDIPEINKIEFSQKIYTIENELTKFRYDALLSIDKKVGKRRRGFYSRHKYQEDMWALRAYGNKMPVAKSGEGACSPAYVIYTSGTTGKPRGVIVEHRALVNLCWWHHGYYNITERDRAVQFASFSFDASVWEVFPYLVKGAVLIVVPNEMAPDVEALNEYFEKHGVTVAFLPTPLCEQFMEIDNHSLQVLLTGGDKLHHFIKRNYRLYNNYGPTENTVVAAAYKVEEYSPNIPIGMPIANNRIYILDKENMQLQPVGAPGELCIAGDSLARGYLNQPELTVEKFIKNRSYRSYKTYIFYKTGDLARRLANGNIEFLGRIDQQVKIRGFRIELGEIEALLLKHNDVEEAVVALLPDCSGNLQLYAYVKVRRELLIQELRDYLSRRLPAYMIPGRFVFLERVPLTPSGKIDRKALPSWKPAAGTWKYRSPRDEVEKKLLDIWSEILEVDKELIGIDGNFFQLGGHSLKVISLIMKIHRELSVKIGMTEVFKNPTVRGLAGLIRGAVGNRLVTIPPAEEMEYYSLSSAQARLYVLYQLDPQNTVYNVTTRVILEGRLDRQQLENSFRDLIRRHESLRTSFQIIAGNPVQRVHKEVEFKIEYDDAAAKVPAGHPLRAKEREEKKINHFIRAFDLSNAPLLRVTLVKMEECQHLLMVDMPHILSDGLSHRLLVEEFKALYRGERLPSLRLQYKDFSQWQNSPAMREEMRQAETFWLSGFQGEIPMLQIPLDYPRTENRLPEGSTMTFELAATDAQKLREMAAEEGATLFMVILAVFNVLLYKLSGQEDIVVGTAVAGRSHPDLERIIGIFLNTLALRNFPRGQLTFKRFLTEVKERTLAAFDHQDYQFEELVQKVVKIREKGRHPLFDVLFGFSPYMPAPTEEKSPGGENPDELQSRPYKRKGTGSRFDITFTGADNGETFVFLFEYSTALFKPRTMERFAGYLKEIAASVTASPQVLLKDIVITTDLTLAVSDAFRDDENDFKF